MLIYIEANGRRRRRMMMMHKYLQVSKVKRHVVQLRERRQRETAAGSSIMHASFTIN